MYVRTKKIRFNGQLYEDGWDRVLTVHNTDEFIDVLQDLDVRREILSICGGTIDPAVIERLLKDYIAANDKISEALKKTENTISVLANEVIANEKVTTAAVSKLAESVGTVDEDGVIGYTPDTNTTYLKTATSVHDATIKLDAAIKTVKDSALTSVAGSQAITVSGNNTVSLKLDAVKTNNALTITTDGLYLSNVWDCGEY